MLSDRFGYSLDLRCYFAIDQDYEDLNRFRSKNPVIPFRAREK
jgi:hypothetical protein